MIVLTFFLNLNVNQMLTFTHKFDISGPREVSNYFSSFLFSGVQRSPEHMWV